MTAPKPVTDLRDYAWARRSLFVQLVRQGVLRSEAHKAAHKPDPTPPKPGRAA